MRRSVLRWSAVEPRGATRKDVRGFEERRRPRPSAKGYRAAASTPSALLGLRSPPLELVQCSISDPDVSRPRLVRDATFLEADRREIALRRGPHNQLGFAYQVAFVRVLGRFPPTDAPGRVVCGRGRDPTLKRFAVPDGRRPASGIPRSG